jgi:hypothetical protein
MTDNPFTLHLARDEAFCDREQELEDLLTHVRNGESVVLVWASPLWPGKCWNSWRPRTS